MKVKRNSIDIYGYYHWIEKYTIVDDHYPSSYTLFKINKFHRMFSLFPCYYRITSHRVFGFTILRWWNYYSPKLVWLDEINFNSVNNNHLYLLLYSPHTFVLCSDVYCWIVLYTLYTKNLNIQIFRLVEGCYENLWRVINSSSFVFIAFE